MTETSGAFRGAKLILLLGGRLLVIRRDRKSGIAWPGYLDFPGGGREGAESPLACALRETREEVGLRISHTALEWCHQNQRAGGCNWFFGARLGAERAVGIRFGNEGVGWSLMDPQEFLSRADAIPHFRGVLRLYLGQV